MQITIQSNIEPPQIVPIVAEIRAKRNPEAWRIWASGMAMLRAIHREIEPRKRAMRDAENYCVRGLDWERNDNCRTASPHKYGHVYRTAKPDSFDLAAHNSVVFSTMQSLDRQAITEKD